MMNAQSKVKQGASAKADRATRPTDQAPAGLGDTASVPSAANTAIWDALCKTDPAHTKQFSRAGGFKGTAIKPMWAIKRLTEQFGACGTGWGTQEPRFETVHAVEGEVLVYCTLAGWYADPKSGEPKSVFGVGGDKAISRNRNGLFVDDEAFKKAFTDALMNAFKHVGVGADVHMGLFDDSKYVAEAAKEFSEPKVAEVSAKEKDGDMSPTALKGAVKMIVHHLNGVATEEDLDAYLTDPDTADVLEQLARRAPSWWETGENMPAEFVPLKKRIEETRIACRDNASIDADHWRRNPVNAG